MTDSIAKYIKDRQKESVFLISSLYFTFNQYDSVI